MHACTHAHAVCAHVCGCIILALFNLNVLMFAIPERIISINMRHDTVCFSQRTRSCIKLLRDRFGRRFVLGRFAPALAPFNRWCVCVCVCVWVGVHAIVSRPCGIPRAVCVLSQTDTDDETTHMTYMNICQYTNTHMHACLHTCLGGCCVPLAEPVLDCTSFCIRI
jgi:hypothetical protein